MKIPAFVSKLLIDQFRWLAIAVVIIILTAGYSLVLNAKIQDLRSSGLLERRRVEAELRSEKKYLADLKTSIAEFDQKVPQSERDAIDTFLPTGPDFPGLLILLDDMATRSNLKLNGVAVNESSTGTTAVITQPTGGSGAHAATAQSIPVNIEDASVSFEGGTSYEALKAFITEVESSRRLLDVIQLAFSHEGVDQTHGATYTLVLRTYYVNH